MKLSVLMAVAALGCASPGNAAETVTRAEAQAAAVESKQLVEHADLLAERLDVAKRLLAAEEEAFELTGDTPESRRRVASARGKVNETLAELIAARTRMAELASIMGRYQSQRR